jgi:hypothetical protein
MVFRPLPLSPRHLLLERTLTHTGHKGPGCGWARLVRDGFPPEPANLGLIDLDDAATHWMGVCLARRLLYGTS